MIFNRTTAKIAAGFLTFYCGLTSPVLSELVKVEDSKNLEIFVNTESIRDIGDNKVEYETLQVQTDKDSIRELYRINITSIADCSNYSLIKFQSMETEFLSEEFNQLQGATSRSYLDNSGFIEVPKNSDTYNTNRFACLNN